MSRSLSLLSILLIALLGTAVDTLAGPPAGAQPNFMPALWGDDELWGTKGTTTLPAPNDHNLQSFDKLFAITNSDAAGQLPVAEAAPGNRHYNGGRWFTHTVTWVNLAMADTLLTSYDDIAYHEMMGHLTITAGSPGGAGSPPAYFQCPLLPVKY